MTSPSHHWPARFWLYFASQSVSNLGSAFTTVALPLLVFRLTDSATDLGAATAVTYVPWLLFGLLGGALVDRVDRKRAMVIADLGRGLIISAIPVLSAAGELRVSWIYGIAFGLACLQIVFSSGEFTAVVALVDAHDLVAANGRISASYSAASVAGTALAGLFFAVAPIADAMWIDAASFLASAASLAAIRGSFNREPPAGLRSGSIGAVVSTLLADTKTGLLYVWRHPVLRRVSLQLTVVNLFGSAATSETVLFASRQFGADNAQVGYIYASSSIGVVVFSFVVGPLARRLSLATMILIALTIYGAGTAALGAITSYRLALALWACVGGATALYNISTTSLRQRIVPNELMGRVWNIALTTAWCAIPIGAIAGGAIVTATRRVDLVYVTVGIAIVAIAWLFNRLALRGAGPAEGASDASDDDGPT